MKSSIITATSLLACLGTASAAHVFNTLLTPYVQDFNGYRGTEATLPTNFSVGWDETRTSEPFQGLNTGAFTAYTSDGIDHSFGIRERNPVDLRNARLFFAFTNNTGLTITGFNVSYDVESWYVGDRRNRIRLKYDDVLTEAEAGRATFNEDIFSTDNPAPLATLADTNLNGSLAENRTTVSGFVDLATLGDGSLDVDLNPTNNVFGSLADGETAYFRFQFSNTTGDSGALRSGLSINNLSITAVPEPSTALLGGLGVLALLRRRR